MTSLVICSKGTIVLSSVLDEVCHWNTGTPSGIDYLRGADDILYKRSSILAASIGG
jgi:hypothetical protein